MRDRFQELCEDANVLKKTVAGRDKWKDLKDRLIRETLELRIVWEGGKVKPNQETGLDVICTDVTKRMRNMGRRMTMHEAKKILGIDPDTIRVLRGAFGKLLKGENIMAKQGLREQRWQELKQRWLGLPEVTQCYSAPAAHEEDDPQQQLKARALDVVANDALKRLREEKVRGLDAGVGTCPTDDEEFDEDMTDASPSREAVGEAAATEAAGGMMPDTTSAQSDAARYTACRPRHSWNIRFIARTWSSDGRPRLRI